MHLRNFENFVYVKYLLTLILPLGSIFYLKEPVDYSQCMLDDCVYLIKPFLNTVLHTALESSILPLEHLTIQDLVLIHHGCK